MKSSIGSSWKGGAALLLLLASACSSDGAVQTVPTAGGGSPGKAGTGGTGTAGTGGASAGSSGSSASGSGGVPSAGAAGSSAAGAGSGGLAGSAGGGGLAGTGTGGDTGGGGAASGSGGEATAGGNSGGSGGTGGKAGNPCVAMAEDADMFEGHCYQLVGEPTSWRDAEEDCEERGGYLVTISSGGDLTQEDFDAENAFVWNLANQMDVWIGATDGLMDDQSGNGTPSTWSNGEMMVLNDWEGGEPSNTGKDCPSGEGMCWEHCGFMWQERGGGWNDEVCADEKPYVCEWNAP